VDSALRRTPFYDCHVAAGARLIDFGGWEMPVQYAGIKAEHCGVREAVGLFDVSHMGEVWVRGPRALDAVRHVVSNDVDIAQGQAQYTVICLPDGGIVDDCIVYKRTDTELLICVNAGNRDKDFAHFVAHNPFDEGEARFEDEGDAWAQVAIQGRHAVATLQKLTDLDVDGIGYYWFAEGTVAGVAGCIVARTGYTGEDGFEVFLPNAGAAAMWPAIMEAGAEFGIQPIGLGARDTLRLEAGMPLYGNDITAETNPFEAKLGWAVKLAKTDFVGRGALADLRARKAVTRRLVGLELDKRIARTHSAILSEGEVVGEVTSGTRSPSSGRNIALGYVPRQLSRIGTPLEIDIRGKRAPARVVKSPFYSREA